MKTGAVIAAAGLSERMGEFKPLMRLNGFSMIQMTVQSAKNAGAGQIVVVTGKRHEEVKEALRDTGAQVVFNPGFETEDMFSSLKLGLERLGEDWDAVFILPGDMPLVGPKTFAALETAAITGDEEVYVPGFEQRRGHPVLIKKSCLPKILSYSGDAGLKGALEGAKKKIVDVDDPGILADADTPEEMEQLRLLARRRRGVAPEVWEELYDEAGLPQHIRIHCRAVGNLAAEMAENLIKAGYRLDVELCRSGGALHDILRLEKHHPLMGARFLREKGYWALSCIVAMHNDFEGNDEPDFDEETIVCLADKLLKEDERVSLAERYSQPKEAFGPDTELGARIREDEEKCSRLVRRYQSLTSISLE